MASNRCADCECEPAVIICIVTVCIFGIGVASYVQELIKNSDSTTHLTTRSPETLTFEKISANVSGEIYNATDPIDLE